MAPLLVQLEFHELPLERAHAALEFLLHPALRLRSVPVGALQAALVELIVPLDGALALDAERPEGPRGDGDVLPAADRDLDAGASGHGAERGDFEFGLERVAVAGAHRKAEVPPAAGNDHAV